VITAAIASERTMHRPATAAHPATQDQSASDTRFLDRPSGQIAYDDRGSGPLVVMVPGLGDVRAEYRFLAAKLVDAGYRAVTMDLRGHGESSTGWPDYSCTALGEDIVALVDYLDAGPAILIGTSMGAGAVAWAAAEAPERTAGVVLIGPFVRDVPPWSKLKGAVQWLMIKVALAGPWAARFWGGYYDALYPTSKPADLGDYRSALVRNLGEPGRMAALKGMIYASKADVAARLGEVRAPTLVIMGTKDPDFANPASEAEIVADLLNGEVVMVEGAGHYPHAEMPEVASPPILDFLAARAAR
jgi:pimeloyl-ACP methyl ester carboxylesterase